MPNQRKPAIVFIFITLVLDIIGIGLIVPILPKLITELHGGGESGSALTYGLLVAIYSTMQFIFAPLLGSLSDRFGRRPIILISLLGAGLDYFLLAWAPTLTWFFIGRILSGITGANFSAAAAYIADVSPPEKRAANFGMIGAAFGIGFIIGPAAGGTSQRVRVAGSIHRRWDANIDQLRLRTIRPPRITRPEQPPQFQLAEVEPGRGAAGSEKIPLGHRAGVDVLSCQPRPPGLPERPGCSTPATAMAGHRRRPDCRSPRSD